MTKQKHGVAPIRFGELDGSREVSMKDDDETVDPLDVGRDGPELPDEDADPRADDPFAEPDIEADIEDVSDEEEPEDEPEAEQPDEDDPKTLRAQLEAERQQRLAIEREREEARRELEEARKTAAEARTKRIDDELAAARVALKAAIEEGDTDKQVELQDKLAELRAEKLVVGQPQRAPAPADDMPHVQAHTPAAQEWIKGKAWINDRNHKQANQDLLKMAGVLAEEGYDANSPDFFGELERRMQRRHPALFSAPKKPAAIKREPGKQAVSRVSRDNPPAEPRQGKTIKLTSADLATMRRFNLDPNNKEHLREFARGKVS